MIQNQVICVNHSKQLVIQNINNSTTFTYNYRFEPHIIICFLFVIIND